MWNPTLQVMMPIPRTGISDEDSVDGVHGCAQARHSSSRTMLLDAAMVTVGVALMARQVVHAAGTPGIDFVHVWNATHHLLRGDGAYRDPLFTYPPGSAVLLAPVGLFGYGVAKAIMLAVNVTAVVAAAWVLLITVRPRPTRRVVALATVALGSLDAVVSTWANGNVNGLLLLVEVLAVRAARRGRWDVAALLVGVSLAVKPVLLPLLAAFVLARCWRALATAVATAGALTTIGWVVVPDAGRFVHVVVPFLMRGAQLSFNDSAVGAGHVLGLGSTTIVVIRVCIALTALVILGSRWRRPPAGIPKRDLVYFDIGVALAATFLVAPMSETYYTLFLLPSAVWLALAHRRRAVVIGALGVTCFATLRLTGVPGDVTHMTPLALRPTVGWILALGIFAGLLRKVPTKRPGYS